jgi:3-deoxy-manno-octulosonate cytidylyltransferase (CMP-KDO synthetase)
MSNRTFILIPSRIGSTRLPKKPLVNISGKSLIQRVFTNVDPLKLDTYIATDSDEIFEHVLRFTKNVVMTDSKHISGTDRVFEAATKLKIKDDDLVINLQGDEPFIPHDLLSKLINDFNNKDCDVISASHPIFNDDDVNNKNCVKVIINENGYAKNFERELTIELDNTVMRHIGIYGYKYKTLSKIINLKPTLNELEHKLEQLRFLDNNLTIYMSQYNGEVPTGIDTKEDVIRAKEYLRI